MDISEPARAEACLARIGYYRLSAYWYPFRKSYTPAGQSAAVVADEFHEGTEFSTCLDLYVFDKKLRLLALDALERIEIAVRTEIALLLGARDMHAHRLPIHLDGDFTRIAEGRDKSKHDIFIDKLDKYYRISKEDFVEHFKNKYSESHLPIWIASELWDFGMLSNFLGGMKPADKDIIARKFNIRNGRVFENWIRGLNIIRNICSHHSRLWNRPFVNIPRLPNEGEVPKIDHLRSNRRHLTRVYAAFSIMKYILDGINPSSTWGDRLREHTETLPESPIIWLWDAGFPPRWHTEDLWLPAN